MENLVQLLDARLLLLACSVLILVFLIVVIILWSKLNKLRKMYLSMLNGSGTLNVEETLIEIQQNNAVLKQETDNAQQQMDAIVGQMKKMKSNLGVYRFNAFAESGSDQSFSIALVDDEQDGVVISGIHNRDETYVFAKPLERGISKYMLSPEEKEAILRSGQKK
ncbi:DUF4446 family protein [Paenibacillus sp. FSL H7-0331]|uniref:DUF4446 family protein n=1 Tax=Paenibacillus sp. FSL H7-0331 TaxID=1920421 RepID=UPI0009701EAE|nr:DUF4446 family protein [Paenibacillus sp. FSL H7-0331]OMF02943.1 hypothetical protein BK127_36395 [Paenibacillus sp. FSL H7-0331]